MACILLACGNIGVSSIGMLAQAPTNAPVPISVDVDSVLADVSRHPLGLNTSWMTDSDSRRPPGSAPLVSALKSIGAKYLRYPGGEESNIFLWSVPPYTKPSASLALPGPDRHFPNQFSQWVGSDNRTLVKAFGFDEFMQDCMVIHCVPVIVVPLRPYRQKPLPHDPVPTREELIANAAAWVHYANVQHRYGIKYWEIGNEYWNSSDDFSGPKETTDQYIRDVIDFSAAMKKEDPTVLIGAGAYLEKDAREILDGCSKSIDFLSVHPYPLWFDDKGFIKTDFHTYQTTDSWDRDLIAFENAIAKANISDDDKRRIMIASTETNSLTGGELHPGSSRSDLWHTMALFDFLGAQMLHRRNLFSTVWVTRWVSQEFGKDVVSGENTLDDQNQITATGWGLALWGRFVLEQLVSAEETENYPLVHAFAAYDSHTGDLHIFLVNKDTVDRSTVVQLMNYAPREGVARRQVLSGTGATDPSPTFRLGRDVSASGDRLKVNLPGPSITVLSLHGEGISGLNHISNSGFEAGTLGWRIRGPVNLTFDSHSGVQAISMQPGGMADQSLERVQGECELSGFGRVSDSGSEGRIGIQGTTSGQVWEQSVDFASTTFEQKRIKFYLRRSLRNANVYASFKGKIGDFLVDDLFLSCDEHQRP
jgi:alpha-L-arabinofuranosidase